MPRACITWRRKSGPSSRSAARIASSSPSKTAAAGSARFLEVVATRLGVDLSTLADLSRDSRQAALISSMCVVFAETEIIGVLAEGIAPADIAAGGQKP